MAKLLSPTSKNFVQKTLDAQLLSGATASVTLNNVDGIPNLPGAFIIDRVDSNGGLTTSKREVIEYTAVSGNTLTGLIRNADSSGSDQDHEVGAIVEFSADALWGGRVYTALAGLVDANDISQINSSLVTLTGTQVLTNKTLTSPVLNTAISGTAFLDEDDFASDSATKVASQQSIKAYVQANGGAFWKDVPGTPTRVSDTQFTITDTSNANSYDLLFKKGVVLKWLETSTFQTAMVISSSYSSNNVTINIVGDSLTAGFTSMKYAIQEALVQEFIIPGTLPSSATTDITRSWQNQQPIYVISADLRLDTAGASTGSTVVDINDDGSTLFTTKPTITTTGTEDNDNVSTNPSTAVAAASIITIDVDSVTATAPAEAYVKLWYYPVEWRYR